MQHVAGEWGIKVA